MIVTLWCGPVPRLTAASLRWPGSEVRFVPCSEQSCAQTAAARLKDVTTAEDVYLAAWGPGGIVAEAWLTTPQVRGVYLADALAGGAHPALLDWIVRAAKDPALRAVITTSAAASAGALEALARAAEDRGVGWTIHHPSPELLELPGGAEVLSPSERALDLGDVALPPLKMWSAGGAFLLEISRSITPQQHLGKVAPILWPRLFTQTQPLYQPDAGSAEGDSTRTGWTIALWILGGAVVAGGVAAIATSSKAPRVAEVGSG